MAVYAITPRLVPTSGLIVRADGELLLDVNEYMQFPSERPAKQVTYGRCQGTNCMCLCVSSQSATALKFVVKLIRHIHTFAVGQEYYIVYKHKQNNCRKCKLDT